MFLFHFILTSIWLVLFMTFMFSLVSSFLNITENNPQTTPSIKEESLHLISFILSTACFFVASRLEKITLSQIEEVGLAAFQNRDWWASEL